MERHTAFSLDLAVFLQNVAFRPNGDANLKSDVTQRIPVALVMYDSSDFYRSNAAFAMLRGLILTCLMHQMDSDGQVSFSPGSSLQSTRELP
jgi:hypothetical protein